MYIVGLVQRLVLSHFVLLQKCSVQKIWTSNGTLLGQNGKNKTFFISKFSKSWTFNPKSSVSFFILIAIIRNIYSIKTVYNVYIIYTIHMYIIWMLHTGKEKYSTILLIFLNWMIGSLFISRITDTELLLNIVSATNYRSWFLINGQNNF